MKLSLKNVLIEKYGLDEKTAIGTIMSGSVSVNGQKEIRVNSPVDIDKCKIEFIGMIKREVSRGALKLERAFDRFNICLNSGICLDVGSSTGGFTSTLLKNGAKRVYAVDCGTNQLDYSLRIDSRVVVMENQKAQLLTAEDIPEDIDLCTADLSFTSSVSIIEYLKKKLAIQRFVVLIKPQFEYSRLVDLLQLSKNFNGIVKNDDDRVRIVDFIKNEFIIKGFNIKDIVVSPIKGSKGNEEYLFYLQ